jgi:hypothetical protein
MKSRRVRRISMCAHVNESNERSNLGLSYPNKRSFRANTFNKGMMHARQHCLIWDLVFPPGYAYIFCRNCHCLQPLTSRIPVLRVPWPSDTAGEDTWQHVEALVSRFWGWTSPSPWPLGSHQNSAMPRPPRRQSRRKMPDTTPTAIDLPVWL